MRGEDAGAEVTGPAENEDAGLRRADRASPQIRLASASGDQALARAPTIFDMRRVPVDVPQRPYLHLKDPCPAHDGSRWHLFGTGVLSENYDFEIFHAIAERIAGPWRFLAHGR